MRGANESLAQTISQCRRTQTIVLLETGVFYVQSCKSILVTEAERMLGAARDFDDIETICDVCFK